MIKHVPGLNIKNFFRHN